MTNKTYKINKIPFTYGFLTLTISLLGIVLALLLEQQLLIVPATLGIAFLTIMFYNKKFWLYSVALFSSVFFLSNSKGVSVLDVFVGVYLVFGLAIWFFLDSICT